MPSTTLFAKDGRDVGTVELPDGLFAAPVNNAVMHQAVTAQLNGRRIGTHSTKTRGMVRGGGKKPYRQKGTGRARQGSIRSPQWAGGGVVFGPTPRSYRQEMPRKQRRLALRSALAAKAQDGHISVLGGFELDLPRTRAVVDLLGSIEAGARVLVVLGSHNEHLERSARNLPEVRVILAANLSVRDLITADTVLMTRDALDHVEEAWS
jgi:large subunit ribosomal protein L4